MRKQIPSTLVNFSIACVLFCGAISARAADGTAVWPPENMKKLPADYLERLQAAFKLEATEAETLKSSDINNIDKKELNKELIRWVRFGLGALVFGQEADKINKFFELDAFKWTVNPKFGFSLFSTEYMRLYGLLNNRTGSMKGLLSPAAQANYEKGMWEVAKANSKLAEAQRGVWEMEGSENHHLSSKVSDLLTAQYLRNILEYANQKYDDGSTLAQQYEVRHAYFLKWFDEHAKHGQFTEAGSPSYQGHSLNAIFNLRDFAEDPVLRKKADMYIDLAYANIAEETLLTTRGGPKSRCKVGHEYDNGMCDRGYDLIFNAPGRTYVPTADNTRPTSDYYPSPAIVNLAKDTTGRGSYVFMKRWPGPTAKGGGKDMSKGSKGKEKGKEAADDDGEGRSLWRTLDPEKNILRYGFATPSYVIGSVAIDPTWEDDVTKGNRWQGIVFARDPLARIGFEVKTASDKDYHGFDEFISVQDRNILVTKKWAPVPPNPKSANPSYLRVYFSPTLDEVSEDGEWIFVKAGNAFTAVKVVNGGYAWTTPWKHDEETKLTAKNFIMPKAEESRCFITLNTEDSPVIMVANEASDYKNDFAAFKTAVSRTPVKYADGVLEFATIKFHGISQPGEIKGKNVNLAPARGYDSPFIRSDWNSGLIYIRKGNDTEILDFRDPNNPVKTVGAPVTSEFPSGVGDAQPIIFK